MGFWVMVGPVAIKSLQRRGRPLAPRAIVAGLWASSSLPVVVLGFGVWCLLIGRRLTF